MPGFLWASLPASGWGVKPRMHAAPMMRTEHICGGKRAGAITPRRPGRSIALTGARSTAGAELLLVVTSCAKAPPSPLVAEPREVLLTEVLCWAAMAPLTPSRVPSRGVVGESELGQAPPIAPPLPPHSGILFTMIKS